MVVLPVFAIGCADDSAYASGTIVGWHARMDGPDATPVTLGREPTKGAAAAR